MSCPFYGRNARPGKGKILAEVPFSVCGLTECNPCDMKMSGLEPDVQICQVYQLYLRDPFPKIALTAEQRKLLGIPVYRAPRKMKAKGLVRLGDSLR